MERETTEVKNFRPRLQNSLCKKMTKHSLFHVEVTMDSSTIITLAGVQGN